MTDDCKPRITPLEVRPNIGAATAAAPADEPRLEIGKPYIVRPSVSVESNVMTAMAIDQHAAHAHLAHVAESDLEWSAVGVRRCVAADRARHAAIEAQRKAESNYQSLGPRHARELLRVVGVNEASPPFHTS